MTRLQAKNHLIKHYLKHDSFEWKTNNEFLDKFNLSELAAIRAALFDLESEDKFVTRITLEDLTGEIEIFVLNKSISLLTQDIKISYEIAVVVAEVINTLCAKIGVTSDLSDPCNITEKDLRNLIFSAQFFATKLENMQTQAPEAEGGSFSA